jgi:hypothetical protein
MNSVKPRGWFTRLFAKTAEKPPTSKYHAVAVRCGKSACQAAQDNLSERHLSAEAPLLPLKQCDRPEKCQCRYQHYDDRRGGFRRNSDDGLPAQTDTKRAERRNRKDRRAENVGEEAEPFSVHDDSYYEYVGDTIRTAFLETGESEGVDPYNSGSFDKSKSWNPGSGK